MNIANTPPPGGPQLEMGAQGGEQKARRLLDTESPLGQQQQSFLAHQRERLCRLVADKANGAKNEAEIQAVYRILSGKIHVGEWRDFKRVSEAIQTLGSPYHQVFVILGGWHHDGDVDGLTKPDADLLNLVKKYWHLRWVNFHRTKVAAEGKQTWSDNVDELIHGLKNCPPGLLPFKLWRQPAELGEKIEAAKRSLEPRVESALLFLQPRIFVFSPDKGKPESGWNDYFRFMRSYNEMLPNFRSEFSQYYWGIY